MSVQVNPKDFALLLTQLVRRTDIHRFIKDPEQIYFVLQGPKPWMDTFIHFNHKRPLIHLQYGDDPSKPSVRCYLSNVNPCGVEFKHFRLNIHLYKTSKIFLPTGERIKKAGDLICYFEAKAPDTFVDQYSTKECHFQGGDTDLTDYVVKSLESHK